MSQFPEARKQLIQDLGNSNSPILRTITTYAIPKLFISDYPFAQQLIDQLLQDSNSRVRAGLAAIVPHLIKIKKSDAHKLIVGLWADKDPIVRAAMINQIVQLSLTNEKDINYQFILDEALLDPSPGVRIQLGSTLLDLLEQTASWPIFNASIFEKIS